jgi:hypothetical protein
LYGGVACKAWLVVQASLNFGEEQTKVNLESQTLILCKQGLLHKEK